LDFALCSGKKNNIEKRLIGGKKRKKLNTVLNKKERKLTFSLPNFFL